MLCKEMFRNTLGEEYPKKPQERGSLAEQIREKLSQSIEMKPKEINFVSKTFGLIQSKNIQDETYGEKDIRGFFSALDFSSIIYVIVKDKKQPYITPQSLLVIRLGAAKNQIPVYLFWECLPQHIRNRYKNEKNFYTIYKTLFATYKRTLIPSKHI